MRRCLKNGCAVMTNLGQRGFQVLGAVVDAPGAVAEPGPVRVEMAKGGHHRRAARADDTVLLGPQVDLADVEDVEVLWRADLGEDTH